MNKQTQKLVCDCTGNYLVTIQGGLTSKTLQIHSCTCTSGSYNKLTIMYICKSRPPRTSFFLLHTILAWPSECTVQQPQFLNYHPLYHLQEIEFQTKNYANLNCMVAKILPKVSRTLSSQKKSPGLNLESYHFRPRLSGKEQLSRRTWISLLGKELAEKTGKNRKLKKKITVCILTLPDEKIEQDDHVAIHIIISSSIRLYSAYPITVKKKTTTCRYLTLALHSVVSCQSVRQ